MAQRAQRPKARHGEPQRFLDAALSADHRDCIIWPYGKANGYGRMRLRRASGWFIVNVNRHVCELKRGPAPDESMEAAHSCGVRACIQWRHLRWATCVDNSADKVLHGTLSRGEGTGVARLSDDDVLAIAKDVRPDAAIAAEYGVGTETIRKIHAGINWSWLTGISRQPKNGALRGSQQMWAKLSEADVLAIVADPRTPRELAPVFGCSFTTIYGIRAGRAWKWLTGIGA